MRHSRRLRESVAMRRTTLISYGLAAFVAGLGLARVISLPAGLSVVILLAFFLIARRPATVRLCMVVVMLMVVAGIARGSAFLPKLSTYNQLKGQQLTLEAVAQNDAVYADKGQLSFDIGSLQLLEPSSRPLVGVVGVKGYGLPMVFQGDKLQIKGKMSPARGSRQAYISFAQIELQHRGDSRVNKFRRDFAAGLGSTLPEPLASFGLGLLIGQRTTLPKELNDQLSTVGLTHIVAVSGYNLTIIIMAASRLLGKRSKYQTLVLTLAMIAGFLLLVGGSASIVRAALVSGLSLAAWYYGRTFRPLVIILLAAAITAGIYPVYLWSDIGWYLSFLAFFGVLVVAPALTKRFLGKRKPKIILAVLIETTAAQLTTLPLIMYIFGRLSVVALVANMLVVPLVPLAMLTSFMAGLAGMVMPNFAGWLAWPAKLLMSYMIDVVQIFARLPKAAIQQPLHLPEMVALYTILVALLLLLRIKGATITDAGTRGKVKLELCRDTANGQP